MASLQALTDLTNEWLSACPPGNDALPRAQARIPSIRFLDLPTPPSLRAALQDRGCSSDTTNKLDELARWGDHVSAAKCQSLFTDAVKSLSQTFRQGEEDTFVEWENALRQANIHRFIEASKLRRQELLDEIDAAKLRYSSSSPVWTQSPRSPPDAELAGSFTEEALEILQTAFQTNDTVTRAEVKGLSTVTGLSARQIRTWFANQRQRRHKRLGPYSTGNPRFASSRRPSSNAPRRTVSNSSSSSSLLSYPDSNSSDIYVDTRATTPDLPFDPCQISPNSASFAQFAQQFHIESSAHAQDGDVPMMSFTQPTPVVPHFPLPLDTSMNIRLPPPPPTAATDAFFFGNQTPASSPLPLFQPVSPSSSYSSSSLSFGSPPLEPRSPANSNSNPFFDQLQSTNPFLDDQFLENVFGSLEGIANGGLTLSMESLKQEEEAMEASRLGQPATVAKEYNFHW